MGNPKNRMKAHESHRICIGDGSPVFDWSGPFKMMLMFTELPFLLPEKPERQVTSTCLAERIVWRWRGSHHKHQPLHGKNRAPKDRQVASPLVLQGILQVLRVVSSDYGKPWWCFKAARSARLAWNHMEPKYATPPNKLTAGTQKRPQVWKGKLSSKSPCLGYMLIFKGGKC